MQQDKDKVINELLDFVSFSLTVTTEGDDIIQLRTKAKELLKKYDE